MNFDKFLIYGLGILVIFSVLVGIFAVFVSDDDSTTTLLEDTQTFLTREKLEPVKTIGTSFEETCVGRNCVRTLYGGIRNVYEDEEWKKVEDARSLKGKGFEIVYLENDSNFSITVEDFNYTSIKVKLKSKIKDKNVPLRFWKYNKTKDNELNKTESKELKEEYKLKFDKVKEENKTYSNKIEMTYNFELGDILEFGFNSTTITLQEANTENLDDTFLYEGSKATNYGSVTTQFIGEASGGGAAEAYAMFRFNISSVPPGSTIDEATINIYFNGVNNGGANGGMSSHHVNQYWIESFPTWNNFGAPNSTSWNATPMENISQFGTTGLWKNLDIVPGIKQDMSDGNNYTGMLVRGADASINGFNDMYYKEYATPALRPYLNITYTAAPSDTAPNATLISPTDKFNATETADVTFNCSGIDTNILDNVTLTIDGVANFTVTNGVTNFSELYTTVVDIPEGNHTWNCIATDNESQTGTNTSREFNVRFNPIFVGVTDQTIYNNQSLGYDITVTDDSPISAFIVNNTDFTINTSGYLTNTTALTTIIYNLEVTVNDTFNNINSTTLAVKMLPNTTLEIYDELNDTTIDTALWKFPTGGAAGNWSNSENKYYLQNLVLETDAGTNIKSDMNTTAFALPTLTLLNQLEFRTSQTVTVVNPTGTTEGYFSLVIFGELIYFKFKKAADGKPNTQEIITDWVIYKNASGVNNFSIYSDGNLNRTITAIDNNITFKNYYVDDANHNILLDSRINYLYYSIETITTTNLITPLNNSIELSTMNFTANSTTLGTLENITLYIDGSANETTIISGLTNETTWSKTLGYGSHTWHTRTCDDINRCDTSAARTVTSSKIRFDSESYPNSTVEGNVESFELNVTTDGFVLSSAEFIYDGMNYTVDSLQPLAANRYKLETNFSIPSVLSEVNRTFSWNLTLADASEHSSVEHNVTVRVIGFGICNASQTPYITFNTFDVELLTKLNATLKTAWRVRDVTGNASSSYVNFSFQDLNENTSRWDLCFDDPTPTYEVILAAEYDAVTHAKNYYYLDGAMLSNTTSNFTLYLLNDSSATLTVVKTVNTAQNGIDDVLISIQRYDIGTDTFYTVAMAKTAGGVGEDLVYLNWYDTLYKFIGVLDGDVVFSTSPYKVAETPQVFQIGENIINPFKKFEHFDYSFYYNETSENFVLTYIKPSAEVETACLRVIKRNISNDYQICDTCLSTSSGTLFCNINGLGNGTFIGSFYATGSLKWIDIISINKLRLSIYDKLGNYEATTIAIIFSGIIFALFLVSPALSIIGILLGLIGSVVMGFQLFNYMTLAGIVIVGGFIAWTLKK